MGAPGKLDPPAFTRISGLLRIHTKRITLIQSLIKTDNN